MPTGPAPQNACPHVANHPLIRKGVNKSYYAVCILSPQELRELIEATRLKIGRMRTHNTRNNEHQHELLRTLKAERHRRTQQP